MKWILILTHLEENFTKEEAFESDLKDSQDCIWWKVNEMSVFRESK